jgi:hypothetical protein
MTHLTTLSVVFLLLLRWVCLVFVPCVPLETLLTFLLKKCHPMLLLETRLLTLLLETRLLTCLLKTCLTLLQLQTLLLETSLLFETHPLATSLLLETRPKFVLLRMSTC